jgi:phytoene dehydrogenase-like protein
MGGFHTIPRALMRACKRLGVTFRFDAPVEEVVVGGRVYAYEVSQE